MSVCIGCGVGPDEETLYQCDVAQCRLAGKTLCLECGTSLHARMNHKFRQDVASSLESVAPAGMDCKQEDVNMAQQESNEVKHQEQDKRSHVSAAPTVVGLGCFTAVSLMAEAAQHFGDGVTGLTVASAIPVVGQIAAVGMFGITALTALQSGKKWYSTKSNAAKKANAMQEINDIALGLLSFRLSDIEHKQFFNAEEIQKRYKRFAKYYHPDKAHGDEDTFIRLGIARDVLLYHSDPTRFSFPEQTAYRLLCSEDVITMSKNAKAIEPPPIKKQKKKPDLHEDYPQDAFLSYFF